LAGSAAFLFAREIDFALQRVRRVTAFTRCAAGCVVNLTLMNYDVALASPYHASPSLH